MLLFTIILYEFEEDSKIGLIAIQYYEALNKRVKVKKAVGGFLY